LKVDEDGGAVPPTSTKSPLRAEWVFDGGDIGSIHD